MRFDHPPDFDDQTGELAPVPAVVSLDDPALLPPQDSAIRTRQSAHLFDLFGSAQKCKPSAQLSKTAPRPLHNLASMNMVHLTRLSLIPALALTSALAADTTTTASGRMSATTTESNLIVESSGGPVSYQAVIDRNRGGNIRRLCLPADGQSVVSDLNDIFFYGHHHNEYTLRGWSGRPECIAASSAKVLSERPDELQVQVGADAMGTFKVISTDPAVKVRVAGKLHSYRDTAVKIKRLYAFKPDRIEMTDEVLWVHPNLEFGCIEWTASFLPGWVQSPARLVKGKVKASFYPVGSSGAVPPKGITYPFTAENFLKNGWKVSLLTTGTSFDLRNSDLFWYEKPWQQDWHQSSGFKYNLAGVPRGRPVIVKTELAFARATPSEMPPLVTIHSPGPEAKFMDEKGEVAKCKPGEVVKLFASAVNADGSPVPSQDISWEIGIDAWWKRPPAIIEGAHGSYRLPEAANDEERTVAQKQDLLAVIKVSARGNNGTEATEHFAMLVGK